MQADNLFHLKVKASWDDDDLEKEIFGVVCKNGEMFELEPDEFNRKNMLPHIYTEWIKTGDDFSIYLISSVDRGQFFNNTKIVFRDSILDAKAWGRYHYISDWELIQKNIKNNNIDPETFNPLGVGFRPHHLGCIKTKENISLVFRLKRNIE